MASARISSAPASEIQTARQAEIATEHSEADSEDGSGESHVVPVAKVEPQNERFQSSIEFLRSTTYLAEGISDRGPNGQFVSQPSW
jgi:hypothetical protein